MQDLEIALEDHPGALADVAETLGRAGISIEGGGAFRANGGGVAHFLFADAVLARRVLRAAGIGADAVRDVLTTRLRQDRPGQLGQLARRLADAGVNIEVQYSDHDNQLILVVEDFAMARRLLATPYVEDGLS